ncbi:MAG TPA: hypothetical protein VE291_13590 [Terracidiphilus sp.]|jgi:hypothetical protein|nr:hypothetical protein [Terracidiphilus sp.]
MRSDRPLIVAVLLLAGGLGLIFGYCHGGAGWSVAYPMDGASVKLNVDTYGPAAVGGPLLLLAGLLALFWSFLCAIVAQFAPLLGHEEQREELTRLLE